jgi:23S rRNA (uracil1939-C5)-methyltransferase
VKKGDILELEITKYAFEGKGIAKIDKSLIAPTPAGAERENNLYVVFVYGAYPGDTVKASLTKIKKSYAEAKVVEIIKSSPLRTLPRCKYFGVCGGCRQQDMLYDAQLKYKQEQVDDILKRIGGFDDFVTEEITASENVFFYRNKMEFSFAEKRWLTQKEIESGEEIDREFALGLHIPNMFDKVLDIDECFLQSPESNKILNFTKDFFKSRGVSIYTTRNNEGYLRNLVIKQARHTADLMVNLVTVREEDELFAGYSKGLVEAVPAVTTVVNNINTKKALIATGEYEKVFYGPGYIYDSIGAYNYRISANSFFQTNSLQAEKLYAIALGFAALTGNEIVYDLYSGAGTITIFVSGKAKHVYGFESVEPAVADARENKQFNNITNVDFFTADLNKSFLPLVEERGLEKPDVIILDPPRSGMHQNTVDDVLKLLPETAVYVSCNPATQARDLKLLCAEKYKLVKSRSVDMFPHTYHIENVTLLKLR